MVEGTLQEYMEELNKAKDHEVYKVYEKFADKMDRDIKDPKGHDFWKVGGESISSYGEVMFYETKASLSGESQWNIENKPSYINSIIPDDIKKMLASVFPESCKSCGFHRFFAVKIEETSVGQAISIQCPSCKERLETIEEDW